MSNVSNSSAGQPMEPPFPPKEFQCSNKTLPEFYGHTAFQIFILLVTFYGNFMVVLAVVLFHRMRTITNYFVVSLAVSDLLVATLSLPFRIHQTTHNTAWCLGLEACVAWIVVDIICCGASIWNLAMISVDRFIAIVMPFRYHALMTPMTGVCLIGAVWILSMGMGMLSLINWTELGSPHFHIEVQCRKFDPVYYTVVSVVGFFLPLFIVLLMYGQVFVVAMNQARAVAALQTDSKRRGRRSSINLVKEVKAAKILAIVVGCFVVCWFPFFVLTLVSLWEPHALSKETISKDTARGITLTFVYVLPVLNSTLNPIIYALFNRDFRRAFGKIFARLYSRRLGAIGMDDASMTMNSTAGTIHNASQNHLSAKVRFRADSDCSTPPTIPMRDISDVYNDTDKENSLHSDNVSNGVGPRKDTEQDKPESASTGSLPHVPDEDNHNTVKLPPLKRESIESNTVISKGIKPEALPPIRKSEDHGTENGRIGMGSADLSNRNESGTPARASNQSENSV